MRVTRDRRRKEVAVVALRSLHPREGPSGRASWHRRCGEVGGRMVMEAAPRISPAPEPHGRRWPGWSFVPDASGPCHAPAMPTARRVVGMGNGHPQQAASVAGARSRGRRGFRSHGSLARVLMAHGRAAPTGYVGPARGPLVAPGAVPIGYSACGRHVRPPRYVVLRLTRHLASVGVCLGGWWF